tara:strand:- start:3261 stop:5126 length:1866 start_codon:yes stop_codon:yes gene_type:complete
MADTTFFGRLKTLFNTGTIMRRGVDGKIRVTDTNKLQSVGNLETNKVVDRYSRLFGSQQQQQGFGTAANFQTLRLQLFADYEAMDEDSIISSALDIYADESSLKNEYHDVLSIECENEEVQKVLHNLFYDVLNIEFNLWPWIRNMVKYGDFFLKLDITEKFGVTNVAPISSYELFREEGFDPADPEGVRFVHETLVGTNMGAGNTSTHYENYEIAHFRMLSDTNFLPYGKSMVEAARKVWKQLTLMEDAMLIHRVMRAPERRVFKVDIGNIPPNEVENHMQQVVNKMKKVPFVDRNTGQYNLKFNMENMLEDYYLPIRGGQSGTEIDTLSGMEFTGIEDIEYLRNRMLAALKIPKAFLGYDENIEGKATLAAEDVRFARTIERIQKIVVSELTKIAIVHLYSQGFEDDKLVDFELSLTNPSMIYEQEKISLWSEKVSLASSIKQDKILSSQWIYENIWGLSVEEIEAQNEGIAKDAKETHRLTQLEDEGNDPQVTQESFINGEPRYKSSFPIDEDEDDEHEEGALGRPPERTKYNTDKHVRDRDPIGKKARGKGRDADRTVGHKYKNGSALARESKISAAKHIKNQMPDRLGRNIIKETFKTEANRLEPQMLDERNLIDLD